MSDFLLISVSIGSLLTGGHIFSRKTPYSRTNSPLFILLAFTSACLLAVYGGSYYFTGGSINDVVIYHLKYGLTGAGFLEYLWLIVSTIVYLFLCIIALTASLRYQKGRLARSENSAYSAFLFLLLSIIFNPVSLDIIQLEYSNSYSSSGNKNRGQASDISHILTGEFGNYYKTPTIERNNRPLKNLVFIYAEGLERTYFDESIFPGLINGLRELESKSTHFTNIQQSTGSSWTIAGLVSSMCGIPLFTPSDGNSMSGMDTFLPSAVCMGDLLHDEEYKLIFYGGADLDFSGKGKFFQTHSFDEIYGKKQLLPELDDDSYKSWWGLYDDSLLDIAYDKYQASSARQDNFALFLLTLDTHHPKGHPSKKCNSIKYGDGSNKILNAVACSDYLITKLVNRIMGSPFADQTIIAVASDHLALRNTAFDMLKGQKRRNMFMIIDPANTTPALIEKPGSTLDMSTTVLPFIGFTGPIGLGRNLLDDTEKSRKDIRYINNSLRDWRTSIVKFWNFPTLKHSLSIFVKKKAFTIDERKFEFPALVEFNEELETVIKFDFTGAKKLVEYIPELDRGSVFLLIDECKDIKELGESLGEEGYCLLLGKKGLIIDKARLRRNISYTRNYIRKLSRNTSIPQTTP